MLQERKRYKGQETTRGRYEEEMASTYLQPSSSKSLHSNAGTLAQFMLQMTGNVFPLKHFMVLLCQAVPAEHTFQWHLTIAPNKTHISI